MTPRDRFDQLCAQGDVSGPAPEAAIARAEAALGLTFPPEYRGLLARHGAVLADGLEFYGLPGGDNDPPFWEDVVRVNAALRAQGQAGTERPGFLAICDDGCDAYFFLDTLAPGGRVVAIGPGVEEVFDQGLFAFLLDYAEGRIGV